MSCLDKKLKLNIDTDSDKFTIMLSDENITKVYNIAVIDIEAGLFEVPEVDYSADIYLKSMYFKNYINELSLFGDDVTINCNEKNIVFKSSGDGNSSVIIINDDCLKIFSRRRNGIKSTYNIQYLKYNKFYN